MKKQPQIADAKKLAKDTGADMLIVVALDADGTFAYASHGKDRDHCGKAHKLADEAYSAIGDVFWDVVGREEAR